MSFEDDDDAEVDFGDEVDTVEVKKLSLGDGDADDKRINDIKAKIAADGNNAELHASLGRAYLAASDFEEAQGAFKKALSLAPDNSNTLFDLGRAYQMNDEHQEAEKYFRAAVEKNPNNVKALFQVATSLAETKDAAKHDEALKIFKQIIGIEANHTAALHSAGQILQNKNDFKEAAGFFAKAVAADPTDAQYRAKLIQCYDALNEDAQRETARQELHAEYKKGSLNPNYTAIGRYCCSQFEAGNKFVIAYDHFDGKDQKNKYVFIVFNKGEVHEDKALFRVVLSHQGSGYQLDAVHPDKSNKIADYASEPAYKDVKAAVIQVIQS